MHFNSACCVNMFMAYHIACSIFLFNLKAKYTLLRFIRALTCRSITLNGKTDILIFKQLCCENGICWAMQMDLVSKVMNVNLLCS